MAPFLFLVSSFSTTEELWKIGPKNAADTVTVQGTPNRPVFHWVPIGQSSSNSGKEPSMDMTSWPLGFPYVEKTERAVKYNGYPIDKTFALR